MFQVLRKNRILLASFIAGVILILPLIFLIYMNSMTGGSRGYLTGDFVAHIKLAEGISLDKLISLGVPHLTMHLLFLKISHFFSLSMATIFFGYTSLSVGALMVIKAFFLKDVFPKTSWPLAVVLASVSGYLGAVDNPFDPLPLYLGVWSPLVYHSPTTMWLKPFVALFIWILLRNDIVCSKPSMNMKASLALVLAIATIIKPNFTIAVAPALFVAVCLKQFHWSLLTVFIPAVIILAIQFVITFGSGVDSKVIFTPGLAWSVYTDNIPLSVFRNLFGAIFLSIFFLKTKSISNHLKFLWILTVVSLFEALFLAESGHRFEGMNFGWGYTLAVEFLFLYLIGYCAQMKRSSLLNGGILILFGAHFYYGISYLYDSEFFRVFKIIFPDWSG